jgi:hypothetical protein
MNGKPQPDSVCIGMVQIRLYKCFKPVEFWCVAWLTLPGMGDPVIHKLKVHADDVPRVCEAYGITVLYREKMNF